MSVTTDFTIMHRVFSHYECVPDSIYNILTDRFYYYSYYIINYYQQIQLKGGTL